MFKKALLAFITLAIMVNICSAGIIHYDVDFNSPTHTIGDLPTTGDDINKVSSVAFGTPLVEASLGSLTDQPLVFNPFSSSYNQIRFNMGFEYDNYKLSFDIETINMVNSDYTFSIFFDSPMANSLSFYGRTGYILRTGSGPVGTFTDGLNMHVEVDIDFINDIWTINTGINPTRVGSFYAPINDLNYIRFGLAPSIANAPIDQNILIGIDNILITSQVPVPSSVCLLAFGILSIGIFLNKRLTDTKNWGNV